MNPVVGLIWAQSENGVIGSAGGLPWSLPDDLAHFKRVTIGSTIMMGRRTWDSLPRKPLPGRPNVVVTRNPLFRAAGAVIAGSLRHALSHVETPNVFCIGGAELFRHALPIAAVLEVTLVHENLDGDVHMPEIDWTKWSMVSQDHHPADDRHDHSFTFKRYLKRQLRPGMV